ncbi:Uma2 family endonuclease [Tumidithrix elongata RA019]|uniref:Uma2 family endonuclease n=1 Tax=Tumidithrix elongata BACA0141 TaxID=2716417 RepID=A0AAW9Q5B4_9CYAN|nr:Uma2 family endonuclease [Tumidithrix elongata RA019]
MVQAQSETITLQQFLSQPETKPASEFIDGRVIQKNMPQGKHSKLQAELVFLLNTILKPKAIALAFPELRCTFGGRSIVPDVAVFIWEQIPSDENGEISNSFYLAPDWTIEILSPDQSQAKVTKNILHCLKHGTQMGWLIDPDEKAVFIYRPKQEIEVLDEPETVLPVPQFASDLNLAIADLFAYLRK